MEFTISFVIAIIFFSGIGYGDHVFETRMKKLSTKLNRIFETDEAAKPNVVINFNKSPGEVFNTISSEKILAEGLQEAVLMEMRLLADESQMEVVNFLDGRETPIQYKRFYITNQIFIKEATQDLCESLGSFENVKSIEKELIFHIHQPVEMGPIIERGDGEQINDGQSSWGVSKVRAPEAWEQSNGAGCTVGIIDTGCRATHEIFAKDFLLGWHDAVGGKSKPYDDNGHGTHVTGTICGQNGLGVAPGTKVYSCKACDGNGGCTQSAITECCEYMSEQHPNIVSNSWGGPSGTATYTEIVNGWKNMGMFPVFSAGNSGPSCGSIGSPADYANVCSVAATTDADSLADFSSRGQCKSGQVGPTVSAPGQKITSSWSSSDTSYNTISGTSMAAPHVSAMAALLCGLNQGFTFDQYKQAITNSCKFSGLGDPKQSCGGTSATTKPNNMYGHGRIDCVNGVQFVMAQLNSDGSESRSKRSASNINIVINEKSPAKNKDEKILEREKRI